jgi:hypothetical protein
VTTIEFDRIGRNHNVQNLTVDSDDADVIAGEVFIYARKYLASRDVNVVVDVDKGIVSIFAGFHNGGTGRIKGTT